MATEEMVYGGTGTGMPVEVEAEYVDYGVSAVDDQDAYEPPYIEPLVAAPVATPIVDMWPFTPQPSLRSPNDTGFYDSRGRRRPARRKPRNKRVRGKDARGQDVVVEIEEAPGIMETLAEHPLKAAVGIGAIAYLGWKYAGSK